MDGNFHGGVEDLLFTRSSGKADPSRKDTREG